LLTSNLRLTPAIFLGFFLCVASLAGNADEVNQDEVLELRRSGQVMPLQDILGAIARLYPGSQVLEVELESQQGKYRYEIEILTVADSVRELEIDAHTGAILEDEPED
jgi:uncharacterized membrane protein YkoI